MLCAGEMEKTWVYDVGIEAEIYVVDWKRRSSWWYGSYGEVGVV